MRRAWLVLMLGCGFQSNTPVDAIVVLPVDAPEPDATVDGPALPLGNCATLVYDRIAISVCPKTLGAPILVTSNTQIDTDVETSIPAGLTCAELERDDINDRDSEDVCAIAAGAITVGAGVTVSARGKRPLVFIAKVIQIDGVIDVASRTSGTQAGAGAGSDPEGCNAITPATNNGGGQGGTFSGAAGGAGGNGGDTNDIGGPPMSSIGIDQLRGGCRGGPGRGGSDVEIGGLGGGAVWLAAIGGGTVGLGANAIVNASGAGGLGGTAVADVRGGSGGGSGGMIVLQGATVNLAPTTEVFAVGGGGGGGASMAGTGGSGNEASAPGQGGGGGAAGTAPVGGSAGAGGVGYPAADAARIGGTGTGITNGGGGGGGGAGTIWFDAQNVVGAALVSPPAELRAVALNGFGVDDLGGQAFRNRRSARAGHALSLSTAAARPCNAGRCTGKRANHVHPSSAGWLVASTHESMIVKERDLTRLT